MAKVGKIRKKEKKGSKGGSKVNEAINEVADINSKLRHLAELATKELGEVAAAQEPEFAVQVDAYVRSIYLHVGQAYSLLDGFLQANGKVRESFVGEAARGVADLNVEGVADE